MKIEKYVISLEGSKRIADFLSQKEASEFKVFDAFDGRTGAGKPYFDIEKFSNLHGGRLPSGAEMGCAISHYHVLRNFSSAPGAENDLLLVAEDDVIFTPDFEAVFQKIVNQNIVFDYLILADAFGREGYGTLINFPAYSSHLSMKSKIIFSRFRLYRFGKFLGNPWGTGLYLVTRRGAKNFVDFVESQHSGMWWLADDYDKFIENSCCDVSFYHLKPALANYFSSGESINELILSDYMRRKPNLLELNLINILKYLKIKFVMVARSTFKDFRF